MPVQFSVLPRHNLVLFTYSGHVTLDESAKTIAEAAQHPDHRDGMQQLCDLSEVTSVERNFPELLKMQARIAEDLIPRNGELIVVFYAPTRAGNELAQMACKSWEGLNSVRVLIQSHEDEALAVLGIAARDLAELSETGA